MKKSFLLACLVLMSAACDQVEPEIRLGVWESGAGGADVKNGAVPLGPLPYRQFADSPFAANPPSGYFYLEDFEDHVLDTPGVTSQHGVLSSSFGYPSLVDSVDGDDQDPTDDSCVSCDCYFNINGPVGVEFTFDDTILPRLPTHVGIVYTDSGPGGSATFTAVDANGEIILVLPDDDIADPTNGTSCVEDRFFGIIASQGIRRISLVASQGGIEADHLQYGAPKD